jgi:CheY-like chemotaxis protein
MARLLVVDDDRTLLDLLRVHLRTVGHSVRTANEPGEAIRAILAEKPDLVVCDLKMPYLSGLELMEALRGDPSTGNIPLVVLTASTSADDQLRARALGVSVYLEKPVSVEELLAAIELGLQCARKVA